jgi:hypothetical protein
VYSVGESRKGFSIGACLEPSTDETAISGDEVLDIVITCNLSQLSPLMLSSDSCFR